MNLENAYRQSLEELGYDLEDLYKIDEESRLLELTGKRTAEGDYLTYNKNVCDLAESLVDSLATL